MCNCLFTINNYCNSLLCFVSITSRCFPPPALIFPTHTGIKDYFFYSCFGPLPVKYEPVKKSKFMCAESNAYEQNLLLLTCTQGL